MDSRWEPGVQNIFAGQSGEVTIIVSTFPQYSMTKPATIPNIKKNRKYIPFLHSGYKTLAVEFQ
jgi:hypothetical protein